MEKHEGKDNKNARIKIDYRGIKPRVKFTYPDYKNQSSGSMKSYITLIWYLFTIPTLIISMILSEIFNVFGKYEFLDSAFTLLFMIGWLCFVPYLIYYPFRKKWDKLYPKVQAMKVVKYRKVFTKKDVVERDGKIFVEVPLFANIYFEYSAKKDFTKCLEYMEVKEHDFKMKVMSKKERKNEYIWYMRFYFSEKPIKGKLEVIFA